MSKKTYVDIKYVAYVTTEIEGDVDHIDNDGPTPVAVLVGGERVELSLSESLDQEFIDDISIVESPNE